MESVAGTRGWRLDPFRRCLRLQRVGDAGDGEKDWCLPTRRRNVLLFPTQCFPKNMAASQRGNMAWHGKRRQALTLGVGANAARLNIK